MPSRTAPPRLPRPSAATPPHSPSPSSPSSPHPHPHSPSTPHTTYQSFADLPPSSPVTPPTRRLNGRRSVNGAAGGGGRREVVSSSPAHSHSSDENEEDEGARENGKPARVGSSGRNSSDGKKGKGKDGKGGKKKTTLSKADLVKMTVGIAGAQLAWTVEMAYGTPYLLSLGLSKQGTSLVWMAGPLSGLVVQPVVGALSDSSPSRFRRRQYIFLSTLLILLSTLIVSFALPLASLITSLLPFNLGGLGDWDPEEGEVERNVAIGLGVVGFYALDFALNGLQASLRALVLDLSPPGTHSTSNAYLGLHTHLANILGYLLGYSDLSHSRALRWLGGGQFRKLALVSCAVMAGCVGVTCVTQEEEARPQRGEGEGGEGQEREGAWKKLKGVVRDVGRNLRELPTPVRRVCYVQFFNWTAWFPFLFYSTTYVSESLYASYPPSTPSHPHPPPSADEATRLGSLALLLYALVSLLSSILLPTLTTLGSHYPSLPRRLGPFGRFVLSKVTPRNCWTLGLVWYAVLMAATFWVRGVKGAMAVVALAGVPWAITCWVPFALVMESIRDLELAYEASTSTSSTSSPTSPSSPSATAPPSHSHSHSPRRDVFRTPFRATAAASLRQASFTVPSGTGAAGGSSSRGSSVAGSPARGGGGGGGADERTALLGKRNGVDGVSAEGGGEGGTGKTQRPSGGTLLGIHNLAIVFPQFFVALVAAIIFHFTSSPPSSSPNPSTSFLHTLPLLLSSSSSPPNTAPQQGQQGQQTNDVVWVLRFGGLFALLGALVSASGEKRWGLVETGSERGYRWWMLEGWRDAQVEGGEEGEEGGTSGSEA